MSRNINLIVIHCSATPSGKPLVQGKPGQPAYLNAPQVINAWHAERGFRRQPAAVRAFSTILMQDSGVKPVTAYVDLGYRGVDADNPGVSIKHRGKRKQLNAEELKLLKRRQAIEPVIGHLKQDHRLDRCHLKGEQGDRLHAVLCAAGYNFRWLLRMIAKKGITFLWPVYLRLRGMAGMPQKWNEFVAQISKMTGRPSNRAALAHG